MRKERIVMLAMAGVAMAGIGMAAAGLHEQPKEKEQLLALVNAGFEEGKDAPTGWKQGATIQGVTYSWDQAAGHGGKASVCIQKTARRYFPIAAWNQSAPHTGKTAKLKITAWVKADQVTKALLDASFDGASPGHMWAAYIGPRGDGEKPAKHDWKEYSGVVKVPADAKNITIGLQVYGPGTIWFDDVKAEYVADSTPPSLYEESGEPKK